MIIGADTVREMKPEEAGEVDALLRAAFGGDAEVRLVQALWRDGDMVCEAVKPWRGRIAGYAALSRMAAPAGWLCLAPVAVWPAFQRGALAPEGQAKGPWQIGRRLISQLLAGFPGTPVVVLGQPGFYRKCGFSSARAARLISPYPVEYTLLAAPGGDVPEAELAYPKAFAAAGA